MLKIVPVMSCHLLEGFLHFFCDNTWRAHTWTRMIYPFSGLVRTGAQPGAFAASIHKSCEHNSTAYLEGP
jgi:hypothetical protein